jgi:hypothetical protein
MNTAYKVKLVVICVTVGVIFGVGLFLFDFFEIPVDIDFKPFFIPLVFAVLLPNGWPVAAVALGSVLGEAIRDFFEGYGPDDIPGLVGFFVSFYMAGYLIGNNPLNKTRIFLVATFVGAFQAAFEAVVFLLFGDAGVWVALWSWAGNSVTHGIIMGAIPTIWLIPKFHGRIERYLGFPPRGKGKSRNGSRNQRRRDRNLAYSDRH